MSTTTVTMPHQLGQDEATRRLKEKLKEILTAGTGTTVTWLGSHAADFACTVMGFSLTGSVKSQEKSVDIVVTHSWMIPRDRIASEIKKGLSPVLQ